MTSKSFKELTQKRLKELVLLRFSEDDVPIPLNLVESWKLSHDTINRYRIPCVIEYLPLDVILHFLGDDQIVSYAVDPQPYYRIESGILWLQDDTTEEAYGFYTFDEDYIELTIPQKRGPLFCPNRYSKHYIFNDEYQFYYQRLYFEKDCYLWYLWVDVLYSMNVNREVQKLQVIADKLKKDPDNADLVHSGKSILQDWNGVDFERINLFYPHSTGWEDFPIKDFLIRFVATRRIKTT